MSHPYWLDHSAPLEKSTFDIIIVGGGLTGLSCAYWLEKADKSLNIAILEKGELGAGATGRNAGFVTCGSVEHFNRMVSKHGSETALEIWQFAEENQKLLVDEIIQESPSEVDFRQNGAFSLATQRSEQEELHKVAQLMEGLGVPVETIGSEDVEVRLGATNFVGGIRYPRDAEVHPIKLLDQIRKKIGCSIFEHTEVFRVEEKGALRRISTNRGDFFSTMVIYATNGYSPLLNDYFKEKIYPTRGQMLLMEPIETFMEGPCYANFYLDYFRQLPGGQLLIGGFRQLEKETEVGYSDHITEVIQSALHDFIKKHLPRFSQKKITHRWAGIMGFSVDGEPMIGALPGDSQSLFCGGYTGHGIGMAFHSGKCVADLVFGKELPAWISSRRF